MNCIILVNIIEIICHLGNIIPLFVNLFTMKASKQQTFTIGDIRSPNKAIKFAIKSGNVNHLKNINIPTIM